MSQDMVVAAVVYMVTIFGHCCPTPTASKRMAPDAAVYMATSDMVVAGTDDQTAPSRSSGARVFGK